MFDAYSFRWTAPNRVPHASVSGDDLPLAYEGTLAKFRPAGALCTGREREEQPVLRCHTVLGIEVSHNSPPSHLHLTGYRSVYPHLNTRRTVVGNNPRTASLHHSRSFRWFGGMPLPFRFQEGSDILRRHTLDGRGSNLLTVRLRLRVRAEMGLSKG